MQCELEEQATKLHKAQAELDKAEHLVSEKDTESAIGKAAAEAAGRDISALRGELKAHANAAAKVSCLQIFHPYTHSQSGLGPPRYSTERAIVSTSCRIGNVRHFQFAHGKLRCLSVVPEAAHILLCS